jgi:deoxyribodipyrimidine photo-lyase
VKLYEKERSRTDKEDATSKLSAHLRIGTISPYELYWKTEDCGLDYDKLKTFSRRLFWRDLAYYQLACFPQMRTKSIREHYENTDWVTGEEGKRRFEAWKWGKTGYPIVDAGMRELYATGWMTQSVRMVVASFLVEYLRVNWVKGCEWFHYTLVDADSAINAMMWQNAGKSGIDQWNFVLSPETASQDPTGAYTRKWVPELVALPSTALIHRPWLAPEEVLDQAGVMLGETYPHRIVADLKSEREISVQSTLDMRRRSQHANSDRGYDHITLPDGKRTVVFTKKEYRIDTAGQVIKESSGRSSKQPVKGRSKRGRRGP